ncbi:MAG: hypothetical protein ABIF87_16645 [Pseudomonadota bacterium]
MIAIGDIVLVYYEDEPAFFARIEDITPDRKPRWFQLKLLVLQLPIIEIVWILREEYINGTSFTMGGHTIRMELVTGPQEPGQHGLPDEKDSNSKKQEDAGGKVIPLFKGK